jgi:hypothetical protein
VQSIKRRRVHLLLDAKRMGWWAGRPHQERRTAACKVHIAFCRTPKDPAASLPLLQLRAQIKPKIKPGRSCCQQLP